jgi:hypothetical protein
MLTKEIRWVLVTIGSATIVGVLLLQGCGEKAKPAVDWNVSDAPEFLHEELHPTTLTGRRFSHDSILGVPGLVYYTGGLLWVHDYAGPPYFHIYDPGTGSYLRSIGEKGEGPGQFTAVMGLSSPDITAPKILALGARAFTLLDPDPIRGDPPVVTTLPEGAIAYRGVAIGPTRIVALTRVSEGELKLTLVSPNGSEIRTVDYESLGNDSIPAGRRVDATYNLGMCARPNGEGFVIVQMAAGKIEYFDRDANRLFLADVPFPTNGYFPPIADRKSGSSNARLWYWSCVGTDHYLYALFSGRLRKALPPSRYISAQYIHVFDWHGKLLHVIKLDQLVGGIAVSPDDATLFASVPDSATLYRYALPTAWHKP